MQQNRARGHPKHDDDDSDTEHPFLTPEQEESATLDDDDAEDYSDLQGMDAESYRSAIEQESGSKEGSSKHVDTTIPQTVSDSPTKSGAVPSLSSVPTITDPQDVHQDHF